MGKDEEAGIYSERKLRRRRWGGEESGGAFRVEIECMGRTIWVLMPVLADSLLQVTEPLHLRYTLWGEDGGCLRGGGLDIS